MSANSIKVVARFRPQNRVELESGGKPIVSFDGEDTCTLDVCIPTQAPLASAISSVCECS